MAYEGRNPDGDWFQLVGRATEPTFPGTYSAADKVGTLYYNNGTGTIDAALWIFDAGTSAFSKITPNLNASIINTGNLGAQFGGVPCGTILPFSKDVSSTGLPTGYLLCDGSAVSQSTYSTLYALIGTTWGNGTASGTGTSGGTGKFNLPDMRGLFLRGRVGTSGRDPDSGTRTALYAGGNTGGNIGSYQADEFKSHVHSSYAPNAEIHEQAGGWILHSGAANTGATGGNETRPKNIYTEFIIRYL